MFKCRDGRVYGMYDVYNNAFSHGGKTRMVLDRYFIVPSNGSSYFSRSALQKRTKYGNRNNMSDVTMRIAAVVSHFAWIVLRIFHIMNLLLASKSWKIQIRWCLSAIFANWQQHISWHIVTVCSKCCSIDKRCSSI